MNKKKDWKKKWNIYFEYIFKKTQEKNKAAWNK